ncbi:hypothetical protein RIR_jg14654.t1 [Rhizophagus irregularis DAOM 181602=DAOM 197198]|nr:hypothetical protein RIR_jg14654.t1 [Rhizophagus irregularis DAOM 181602=DAOM 197198]
MYFPNFKPFAQLFLLLSVFCSLQLRSLVLPAFLSFGANFRLRVFGRVGIMMLLTVFLDVEFWRNNLTAAFWSPGC